MKPSVSLFARLFMTYFLVLLAGTACIVANHIMFHQAILLDMLSFQLPFFLLSDLSCALLLLLLSWCRLKPVLQNTIPNKTLLFKRLLQFPYELFGGVMFTATLFILLYHGLEITHFVEYRISRREGLDSLLISIGAEVSITFVVAVLLLVFTKSALHPYLLQLSLTSMPSFKQKSILRHIYLSTAFGFIILLIVNARISAHMQQEEPSNPLFYILVLLLYFLFVLSMVLLAAVGWGRDLEVVHDRLRQLSEHESMVPMEGIPILSYDETASLALAFNKLQTQLTIRHRELTEQLELARQIQQRLLPATMAASDRLQLAAHCQPCYEVGGDFYDVIQLNHNQLLVAIGDVAGKGMSAAMLMSALLAALRIEAAKGGSSGEILTRLNEQMYSITQGRSFVTVGLAVIDFGEQQPLVHYCSAGHMSPYLLTEDGLQELEQTAIPLGLSEDQSYCQAEISFRLAAGQLFIMYTDGVIERMDDEEQMFGFERWEQALLRLRMGQSSSQQLQQLLKQLPQAKNDSHADDHTILLIRCFT